MYATDAETRLISVPITQRAREIDTRFGQKIAVNVCLPGGRETPVLCETAQGQWLLGLPIGVEISVIAHESGKVSLPQAQEPPPNRFLQLPQQETPSQPPASMIPDDPMIGAIAQAAGRYAVAYRELRVLLKDDNLSPEMIAGLASTLYLSCCNKRQ